MVAVALVMVAFPEERFEEEAVPVVVRLPPMVALVPIVAPPDTTRFEVEAVPVTARLVVVAPAKLATEA